MPTCVTDSERTGVLSSRFTVVAPVCGGVSPCVKRGVSVVCPDGVSVLKAHNLGLIGVSGKEVASVNFQS